MALRRAVQINSISGLCLTKLDVLDELDSIRICVGYQVDGREVSTPPIGAEAFEACTPIYEEMPGWRQSTVGITDIESLPQAARDYIARIEAVCGTPVDIISTGPDRDQTIVLRHPYDA